MSNYDFAAKFERGLSYDDFLSKHGTEEHRRRWAAARESIKLTDSQRQLLTSFVREMKVLCLAGAWCGDCVNQCPIFQLFAEATSTIKLRFFDRDADSDLATVVQVCGGARVPIVVFLAEDGKQVGWYGDRTLSKYRKLAIDQLGPSCPTGITPDPRPMLEAVTQDWLDEFERVHLLLRLSSRLRQLHND